MPWSSQVRRRCSSSWTYSLLRARDLLWLSRMRARLAFCYARRKKKNRVGIVRHGHLEVGGGEGVVVDAKGLTAGVDI